MKAFLICLTALTTMASAFAQVHDLRKVYLEEGEFQIIRSDRATQVFCGMTQNEPTPRDTNYDNDVFNMRYSFSLNSTQVMLRTVKGEINLGCCITQPPKGTVLNGVLYVFGIGTDQGLYYKTVDSNFNTSNWISLGGILNSLDMVKPTNDGDINIFGTGIDNSGYKRSLRLGWARM